MWMVKVMTLNDYLEPEHQENEKGVEEIKLESPIQMPTTCSFVKEAEVKQSIRMREIEKDGKKLISVSVFYDLDGREIPIGELENMKHEAEHWLTYLGMAIWVLSKSQGGEVEPKDQKCDLCGNPDLSDSHTPDCEKFEGSVIDMGVRERNPDGKVY
jgi:hypothetical protein